MFPPFATPQSTRGTSLVTLLRDPFILVAAGTAGRQHTPLDTQIHLPLLETAAESS